MESANGDHDTSIMMTRVLCRASVNKQHRNYQRSDGAVHKYRFGEVA